MLRTAQDRYLPPDRAAFLAGEPPSGRVIVIAPTRAACETIEIATTLHLETYLERTHGQRVRELARSGQGFGIIAGTGTGKTLAIRPIAEEILRAPLQVGVVNREREATPELPEKNLIIVTTGIARRWFQDDEILPSDTLIVDEIHQTSAELELCLALGKRVGCRFIWLSATVDPGFYQKYLGSSDVLQVFSFDPEKAAAVELSHAQPLEFLDENFLKKVIREKRGVGVFLPTRAAVEEAAARVVQRFPKLNAAFYHGGEPVTSIRPFLEDEGAPKPYLLTMTAAGQSALNVQGLDTVVIHDMRFSNRIEGGRNVLARMPLGNNELLQMAGRVHGRVKNGRVFILSERHIDFATLRPTAPDFQLAGDSERVALTCADLGVRADELELPVPLDRTAYRRAFAVLQQRGIIGENERLTTYGKTVEALPVERAWAELIVNAPSTLLPHLAVMSSIESLHRMTRDERNLRGLILSGSDHLTSYNLYAEAFQHAGTIGEVYGLPRHLFDANRLEQWAQQRGVLVKSIEDAALAMSCVFRSLDRPLPREMPLAGDKILRRFTDLLAQLMPFDLVINDQTADGRQAFVSRSSLCRSDAAVAGTLRYFSDRRGISRATIEGTEIALSQLRRYARRSGAKYFYNQWNPGSPLMLSRTVEYFGFVLEHRAEPVKTFPKTSREEARHTLAQALARGEATHQSLQKNRDAIEEVRELHRRSAGRTPPLEEADLTAVYERQLNEQEVNSLAEFRNARLIVSVEEFVTAAQRQRLYALPDSCLIRDQQLPIEYAIEKEPDSRNKRAENSFGVVRLRLPEKLARTLAEEELPKLDRPLRLVVSRGSRGSVVASTLDELHEKLEGRWIPDEQPSPARTQKSGPTPTTRNKPRHRAPNLKKGNLGGHPREYRKRRRK